MLPAIRITIKAHPYPSVRPSKVWRKFHFMERAWAQCICVERFTHAVWLKNVPGTRYSTSTAFFGGARSKCVKIWQEERIGQDLSTKIACIADPANWTSIRFLFEPHQTKSWQIFVSCWCTAWKLRDTGNEHHLFFSRHAFVKTLTHAV